MQTKRIQCPKCKTVLDVKNSNNDVVKMITCPSCQSVLQVKFPRPMAAAGATQLASPNQKTSVQARLLFGNTSYPLEDGENIVGRKGSSSQATLQIDTDDRYMSRQHGIIKVTTLPDGTKKVVLSNFQDKCYTTVNGQKLEEGDAIRLADGNSITMGQTTMTFKLS